MPFLPLYFRQLGVTDVGEIAFWTGLSLGVTPAVTALLSPFWGRLADRVRPQAHGRALARELRRRHGGDGVRDRGLARLRAARGAGALRRLRRAGVDDGGRVGAARADGVRDRHRADGAAARTGARPGDRRDRRPDRRPAERVPRHRGVLPGGAGPGIHLVSRASRPNAERRGARTSASRSATCSRSRTSCC